MSRAVDANVLLYASDADSPRYERARMVVERLASGPELVYLFWPAAVAYLRISTHPTVFTAPLTMAEAAGNLGALVGRPHVQTPGEGAGFWETLASTLDSGVRGNLVSDAHLVALMRQYGVRRIVTHDRDFRRFDGIETIDPFADPR